MKILLSLLALFLPLSATTLASESPALSSEGLSLGRYSAASVANGLSVRIALNGDEVYATHVTARFQNNTPRQRLANGFWQPWNERAESLTDNEFAATDDGSLTFEILDEDVSDEFLPIIITVAYRTEGGLKSGYLVIDP